MYKLIRNFFWFCSGANKRLLEENDVDHNKYFSIGAAILFTAIFAGFSGGYAMYFVFAGSTYAIHTSISCGVLWGLTIFNIDRFLVMSIKKENKPLRETARALPRIILAVMIGIVIARPLELRIFEKEINEGLKQYYLENEKEILASKTANFSAEIIEYTTELGNKKIELDNAKADVKAHIILRDNEYYGRGGNGRTTGIPGWGKHAIMRQKEVEQKQELVTNIESRIETLEKEIHQKRNDAGLDNISSFDNESLMAQVVNAGFYDRNKILGQISSWTPWSLYKNKEKQIAEVPESNVEVRKTQNRLDGESDPTVFFISLLFIIIETLPILVKLMSKRSVYDESLEHEEDKINFAKIHETSSHKKLVRTMSLSQREVLYRAIDQWRERELDSDNLNERYINNDDDE